LPDDRTPDGQTLILSAQDGYCSIIAFDPLELGTPYKTTLKDLPPPPSPFTSALPTPTPAAAAPAPATLPALFKKAEPTPPAASTSAAAGEASKKRDGEGAPEGEQPVKKAKKRAVLIHHE
jgi:chromatin assembly factor 1 subunit B